MESAVLAQVSIARQRADLGDLPPLSPSLYEEPLNNYHWLPEYQLNYDRHVTAI